MADIIDTAIRTDTEQLKFLMALLAEYDLYQKELTALSAVGFLVHALMENNDGIVFRSNQAIRESHVITARKTNSLYKHAREVDIFPTFAVPAVMQFVLIIQERDFLANATRNGDVYFYYIDIDNFITVGSFIYSFDYPVEIRLENGPRNEKYLTSRYIVGPNKNPVSTIVNPTIKAIRQRSKDGYVFHLYFELKQYHREYIDKTITNRDNDAFHIQSKRTVDQISAMEVFHISNSRSNSGTITKLDMKMHFESSRTDRDTIFVQYNDANNLRLVHKSQQGGFRPAIGDKIHTILYLTTGSAGNFTFGYTHGKNVKFRYSDGNELYCEPYLPTAIASGGYTYDRSKEKLRKDIIVKKSTRDSIVIENDLYMILNNRTNSSMSNFNTYTVIKNRNDIIKIFNIFTTLKFVTENGFTEYTVPTNTLNVEWDFVENGVKTGQDFYMLNKMYVGSKAINEGVIHDKAGIEGLSKPWLKYRVPFLLAYDKENNILRAYDNYIQQKYTTEYNLINSRVPYSYICNWVQLQKNDYYDALDLEFQIRINITDELPKEPLLKVNPLTKGIEEGEHLNVYVILKDREENEVYRAKAKFKDYIKNKDDDFFIYGIRLIEPFDTTVYQNTVQLHNPNDGTKKFVPIEGLKGSIQIITNSERSENSEILDINPTLINEFTFECDLVKSRSLEFKLQHNVLGNNKIRILQLPLVEKDFYEKHKSLYRNSIAQEYYLNNYLQKFQGEFSYSFKYTNSYGYSNTYSIGLSKKDLNNVMLDFKFLVERKVGSNITEEELSRGVYEYINSLNFLNYDEFHISNLYDFLYELFPDDIKLIQFQGMNEYPESDQLISSKISEITNTTIIEKINIPLIYDAENDKFNFKIGWTFR